MARKILEDDFVLQYFFDDHWNLMECLEKSILAPRGEVVLLKGGSGCGITTLLRTLHRLHPDCVQFFEGDIYLGYWDFVDHLCDAFNVRRGDYSRKNLPPHLLKILSLTRHKTLLIDDLDIYISKPDELDNVFGIIRTLTSKLTNLTVVLSTRNAQLLNRFARCSQSGWHTHTLRQKLTKGEYLDFASRLWSGLNREYSLGMPEPSLSPCEIRYSSDIQEVNKALRLQFVELFLRQQGALDELSKFTNLDEYETYVKAILTS